MLSSLGISSVKYQSIEANIQESCTFYSLTKSYYSQPFSCLRFEVEYFCSFINIIYLDKFQWADCISWMSEHNMLYLTGMTKILFHCMCLGIPCLGKRLYYPGVVGADEVS